MKQPHRGALILAALLMAASMVLTPRMGGAAWTKPPLKYPDYPPGEQYGDPEIPDGSPRLVRYPVILDRLMFALKRMSLSRLPQASPNQSRPAKASRPSHAEHTR